MVSIKCREIFCALFLGMLALVREAHATWSIVAVDPETREVGLAVATCNVGVQFVAEGAPGAGVVVALAETSFIGRDKARDWMVEGLTTEEILRRLAETSLYKGPFKKKFPNLQYGVATLNGDPVAGFTGGGNLISWSGGKVGVDYSAQGNTLRNEKVIAATAATFEVSGDETCRFTLGERLLQALEAGGNAGGDKRCPMTKPAQSAIMVILGPEDKDGVSTRLVVPREISLVRAAWHMVVPYKPDPDGKETLTHLREAYEKAGGQRCR